MNKKRVEAFLSTIQAYLYAKPRLLGTLVMLVGIGFSIQLGIAYQQHSDLFERDILFTPGFLLIGLSFLIEPRLVRVWQDETRQHVPSIFKTLNGILLAIACALGFYLRYVVFKDWQR